MSTLQRLKELEARATPGPWINKPSGIVQKQGGEGPIIFWDDTGNKDDYPLIAEMRNSLPKLLLRIEELETAGHAVLQQLHEALMEKAKLLAVVQWCKEAQAEIDSPSLDKLLDEL